jgi:hypothetical protein
MTASLDVWSDVRLIVEGRPRCACGDNTLRVRVVDSRKELCCASCDSRAGLLSDQSTGFILAIAKTFGSPDRPIILRRPQATNSARAEERASRCPDAT